jgi:hypothetical protein
MIGRNRLKNLGVDGIITLQLYQKNNMSRWERDLFCLSQKPVMDSWEQAKELSVFIKRGELL